MKAAKHAIPTPRPTRQRRPTRTARLPHIGRRRCKARPVPRRARGRTLPLDVARLRAGLSVRALARKAGLDAATVSRVLRGVQRGTPKTLARLTRLLRPSRHCNPGRR